MVVNCDSVKLGYTSVNNYNWPKKLIGSLVSQYLVCLFSGLAVDKAIGLSIWIEYSCRQTDGKMSRSRRAWVLCHFIAHSLCNIFAEQYIVDFYVRLICSQNHVLWSLSCIAVCSAVLSSGGLPIRRSSTLKPFCLMTSAHYSQSDSIDRTACVCLSVLPSKPSVILYTWCVLTSMRHVDLFRPSFVSELA